MIKKISAVILSLTLAIVSLSGCANSDKKDSGSSKKESNVSSSDESSGGATGPSQQDTQEAEIIEPSLTIDGNKIDTTDYVMCTIDGVDITFDEFRFYYYYNMDKYASNYGITMDALSETEDGFKTFMDDVVLCIKQELVAPKLAEENDLKLDEEDQKAIDNNYEKAKSNYESEEAYLTDLKKAYLTEDLYRTMLERAQIYQKVMTTLFANDGKYATKHDDFRKLVQDPEEYCREIHVMIPYYSQVELDDSSAEGYDDMSLSQKAGIKQNAYTALDEDGQKKAKEDAKAVAEEVLKKAQDGEDFESLIEQYGWDTGLEDPTSGYYINKGNTGGYPQELMDGAFALKENEITSELVENTTYGYFIIKRLKVDMDYVEKNIDSMISNYDQPAMEDVFNKKIEEMSVTYCDNWDKITIDSIT